MVMKSINTLLSLMLFVFVSCAMTNQQDNNDMAKLQGSWVSQEDNNWKFTFEGDKFFDIYGQESEECTFSISKKSCNEEYTTLEATFLKCSCEEVLCLEITSLTDTTFSYRDTSTGKLHTFKKSN